MSLVRHHIEPPPKKKSGTIMNFVWAVLILAVAIGVVVYFK